MSQTTDQWIRKVSLLLVQSQSAAGMLGPAATEQDVASIQQGALDLSQFRIRFQIRQGDPSVNKPRTAWIRVYNLAPSTVTTAIKEYQSVVLQAGYEDGNFGIIFQGTIKQFRKGHETVVDTFFDIMAADGDLAHNFGVVWTTLAKGHTQTDKRDAIIGAMKPYNVTLGYDGTQGGGGTGVAGGTGGIAPLQAARGVMLVNMAAPALDQYTGDAGATWLIENGQVRIVPLKGYLPGQAVVLNYMTGLIGWPEATDSGIYVRCLLNPSIKCQGLIQLNNAAINQTILNQNVVGGLGGNVGLPGSFPSSQGEAAFFSTLFPTLAADDGFYRVLVVEHEGDTRGQPWYSNLICLLADVSAETQFAAGQAGVSGDLTTPLPPGFLIPGTETPIQGEQTSATNPFQPG